MTIVSFSSFSSLFMTCISYKRASDKSRGYPFCFSLFLPLPLRRYLPLPPPPSYRKGRKTCTKPVYFYQRPLLRLSLSFVSLFLFLHSTFDTTLPVQKP